MKYVNTKVFQRDFFKLVDDLPVTITKYGIPTYVLTKVHTEETKVPFVPAEVHTEVHTNADTSKVSTHLPACAFCKALATRRVRYENPETFIEEERDLCEVHFRELKKTVDEVIEF